MDKEFLKTVRDKILEYMPEGYKDCQVRISEVDKPGGVKLHGLSLAKEGASAAPILYLEQFLEGLRDGASMDEILKGIAEKYDEIRKNAPAFKLPEMTFDVLKDHLRIKLLYAKTNADYLKELVSFDAGLGYSITVYADMSGMLFDGAVVNIRRNMMESLGCSKEELFRAAMEGSVKNCPARLTTMEYELFSFLGGDDPSADILSGGKYEKEDGRFLVLSTKDKYYGACVLYYPGVREKVAEAVGGSYYIIPSSVNEVLVLPDSRGLSAEWLADMVSDVNRIEVAREEQLGNRVLFYDAQEKELSVACDLDRDAGRDER